MAQSSSHITAYQAPKPKAPWSGVRNAKEFGPVCYQFDILTKKILGSEDCLYLNVYTPDLKPMRKLPVMLWVHGGGFISGSGNDDMLGPELLVRHDVIVATFNYRLEVLGFLCLETEDVPGNAGMKDQVAAMRWVKKNIEYFGGDPDNITLFGESAGGASVSYHLISPMSKGLFKRAIVQSGVSTCAWSKAFMPRQRARALARELGFESDNDRELYEFFKSQPIEYLVSKKVTLSWAERAHDFFISFGITAEKQYGDNEIFYDGNDIGVLRKGSHAGVDIMIGYTEHEGIFYLGFLTDLQQKFNDANNYNETFLPLALSRELPIDKQLEAGDRIKKFYLKDKPLSKENLDQFVKYLSAEMFSFNVMEWQRLYREKVKNEVFLYKFTCKTERNVFADIFGVRNVLDGKQVACHADDLCYIFGMKAFTPKINKNADSYKMIGNITKLWTNFAKYGNPTPDSALGVQWKPYTLEKEEYLEIGKDLLPKVAPDNEEVEFWENLMRDYMPHTVIKKK